MSEQVFPQPSGLSTRRRATDYGYILTIAVYVNAFFWHDEYVDFFGDKNAILTDIRKALGPSQPTADGTTRD
ncbi:MAG TPA: hypothetical protein VKP61_15585 [Candidatus Acidoferrum sp.]|nr:hypothetical protein [Candidatus Acidoferrum sp.]